MERKNINGTAPLRIPSRALNIGKAIDEVAVPRYHYVYNHSVAPEPISEGSIQEFPWPDMCTTASATAGGTTTIDPNWITQINTLLAGKADKNHVHSEYALVDHTHSVEDIEGLDGTTGVHNHDDKYAPIDHQHDGYALENHQHPGYSELTHKHDDSYATINHTHTEYAMENHMHLGYATAKHTHDYSELTGLPDLSSLPGSPPEASPAIPTSILYGIGIEPLEDGYCVGRADTTSPIAGYGGFLSKTFTEEETSIRLLRNLKTSQTIIHFQVLRINGTTKSGHTGSLTVIDGELSGDPEHIFDTSTGELYYRSPRGESGQITLFYTRYSV